MQDEDDRRPFPLTPADAPIILLVLAGACALSAAIGVVLALTGRPAPLGVLLAPPAVALVATPLWVLRRRRSPER